MQKKTDFFYDDTGQTCRNYIEKFKTVKRLKKI